MNGQQVYILTNNNMMKEKIRQENIRKNNMVLNNAHIFSKYYPRIKEYALIYSLELDEESEKFYKLINN